MIRPSSLSPKPSPLVDERKVRAAMKREEPPGAEKAKSEQACSNGNTSTDSIQVRLIGGSGFEYVQQVGLAHEYSWPPSY